jgi:hypothetical protein
MRHLALFSLVAAVCGIALGPTSACAQAPSSFVEQVPPVTAGLWQEQADPIPGLPHPTDQPASLYQPAPPVYSCDALPGDYIDCDQRLDPLVLPQPGWVADMEVGIALPHVGSSIAGFVSVAPAPATKLQLPVATLDWTASPRLEIGYRLPEGLGEFALAYRFLGSEGTGTVRTIDAVSTLNSQLFISVLDLDYASNELSICCWWMKWRIGLRGADVFFDSRADEPFAAAAGGSGIVERKVSNNNWGLGPHATLELERRMGESGFFFLSRLDVSNLLGRINQTFTEESTTPGVTGETRNSQSGDMTTLNVLAGFGWRPPRYQSIRCFLGYQYDYWWNVGRFGGGGGNNAEVYDQAVLLRADFNY